MKKNREEKTNNKFEEKLVLQSISDRQEFFILKRRGNIVGRRENASVNLDHQGISRDHASISFEEGHFYLKDLGSKNGTFLNRDKISKKRKIDLGDQLKFASSTYKIVPFKGAHSAAKISTTNSGATTFLSLDSIYESLDQTKNNFSMFSMKNIIMKEKGPWLGMLAGLVLIFLGYFMAIGV